MKALRPVRAVVGLLSLLAVPGWQLVQAQPNACEGIAKDVTAAVHKDPSKLLMIVEDALVINESCACEIIQAAITASHADAATVNQIVQTGISVAPRMAGVITDCAAAIAPGTEFTSQVTSTDSAKNPDKNPGKNPIVPVAPLAPVIEEVYGPPMRGIFLIQPPASGFVGFHRKRGHIPTSPCVCVVNP